MADMASTRVPFLIHPHIPRDATERASYQGKIDELEGLPSLTAQEADYLAFAHVMVDAYDNA